MQTGPLTHPRPRFEDRRVVIDAGPCGNDHGTTGPTGLPRRIGSGVAHRLARLIEEQMGSEVISARQGRVRRAEERPRSPTAIGLTCSFDSRQARHGQAISGPETYYLNFTTSRTALDTATRGNAASSKSVYELKDLLQKIALKDKVG